MEEGKTSSLSDFLIKSPNIQKKRMDFGHGNSNEYLWVYSKSNKASSLPTLEPTFKANDIKALKSVDKWERAFVLDSKYSCIIW